MPQSEGTSLCGENNGSSTVEPLLEATLIHNIRCKSAIIALLWGLKILLQQEFFSAGIHWFSYLLPTLFVSLVNSYFCLTTSAIFASRLESSAPK